MTPFTCHVTPVFVVFMTAAVNGCVFLTTMEAVLGEIEIVTGGSGLEAEIDAQP